MTYIYIYNIIICPVLELALANAGPPTKADAIDAATASRAPWETSPWDPGGEKSHPDVGKYGEPSGKHTKRNGKSPFLIGKSTSINYFYGPFSIAMSNYQRVNI